MSDTSLVITCDKCGQISAAFSSMRAVFDQRKEIDEMISDGLGVDFIDIEKVRNADNWCKCNGGEQ